MKYIPKIAILFLTAFVLNFVWEELHSVLYVHYQGQAITHFVLLRAALVDAVMITGLLLPFVVFDFFRKRIWIFILLTLTVAVVLEAWALAIGRWAYADTMPLLPLFHTGLTPSIQLALLGYISYRISIYVCRR